MREIKFRVESIENNKFIAIEELTDNGWITWYNESGGSLLEKKEFKGVVTTNFPVRRRQYTGRKDKNGREIYEGDIVKINMCYRNIIGISSDCVDKDGLGEALYKVIYLENLNQFCSELISWTKFKPRNKYMHLYTGEIIGNSYGNPELLEQK